MADKKTTEDGVTQSVQVTVQNLALAGKYVEGAAELQKVIETARSKRQLTAMGAFAGWRKARESGTQKAMIEALVDLIELPSKAPQPDTQRLMRMQQGLTDLGVGDDDMPARMWQEFAKTTFNTSHPSFYATYLTLDKQYPFREEYITSEDRAAKAKWREIQAAVQVAKKAQEFAAGVQAQALDAKAYLETHEGPPPSQVEWWASKFPKLGDDGGMKAIEGFITDTGYEPLQSTIDMRDTMLEQAKKIQADPAGTPAPAVDWRAKILGTSYAQWYAKENGFKVGHANPDGSYAAGPDDDEFFAFAHGQLSRDTDEDELWDHRAYQGERDTYGTVVLAGKPDPNAVDGKVYLDPDGAVLSPEAVGLLRTVIPDLDPAKLAEKSVTVQEAPPLPGAVVRGKRLPGRYGQDQEGDVRMLTEEGIKVFKKADLSRGFERTSGGGEKQTVGRFFERVAGRRAANTEERRADQPETPTTPEQRQPAPAEDLARRAEPEYDSTEDRARREDNDKAREEAQAQAKAVADAEDGIERDRDRAAVGAALEDIRVADAKRDSDILGDRKIRTSATLPGPTSKRPEDVLDTTYLPNGPPPPPQPPPQPTALERQHMAWQAIQARKAEAQAQKDKAGSAVEQWKGKLGAEALKKRIIRTNTKGEVLPEQDDVAGEQHAKELARPDKPAAAKDTVGAPSASDVPKPTPSVKGVGLTGPTPEYDELVRKK